MRTEEADGTQWQVCSTLTNDVNKRTTKSVTSADATLSGRRPTMRTEEADDATAKMMNARSRLLLPSAVSEGHYSREPGILGGSGRGEGWGSTFNASKAAGYNGEHTHKHNSSYCCGHLDRNEPDEASPSCRISEKSATRKEKKNRAGVIARPTVLHDALALFLRLRRSRKTTRCLGSEATSTRLQRQKPGERAVVQNANLCSGCLR